MPLTSNSDSCLNLDSLYGLICFEGPETTEFLQRQLCCDLNELQAGQVLPGAWLNPAGRVIATLDLLQHEGSIIALVPRALLGSVIQGLGRYLLNARLTITESNLHLLGQFEPQPGGGWPWPGDRFLHLSDTPGQLDDAKLARWQHLDVLNSLIRLEPGASARYLPQMLDLEARGVISFDKGCFPGQEVVARTHYLGKVKRGLARFRADTPLGLDTKVTDGQGQPVGEIIQSASEPSGGSVCLAVLKAGTSPPLFASGHQLEALPAKLAEHHANG